jgi:hypothetical protein
LLPGFTRVAFADALKADLEPVLRIMRDAGADKETMRPLMVSYGRAMRSIDHDYWVKRVNFRAADNVVVTDVRYVNEVKAIEAAGGVVVLLNRDGYGPKNDEEFSSINAVYHELTSPLIFNVEGNPQSAADSILSYAMSGELWSKAGVR